MVPMNRDKKEYPGLFIVFEGIDGTGKTTQIKKLKDFLTNLNYDVISFYQPTHGSWGKKLRQLFIDGHVIPIKEEIQLSVNDRRESVDHNILPALHQNKIVLLDRYYWSNAAYQGILDESYNYILEQNKEFPEPDVIIYFDIEVDTAYKRILNERKEIPNQFETTSNLQKSKKIFEDIINDKSFTGSLITVSAEKEPKTVFESIKKEIVPVIEKWKKIN